MSCEHDTLVLHFLHEKESDKKVYEIFILYNHKKNKYLIRGGKNTRSHKCSYESYAFDCDDAQYVCEFVEMVLSPHGEDGKLYMTLAGMKTLPTKDYKITTSLLGRTMQYNSSTIVESTYTKDNHFTAACLMGMLRRMTKIYMSW